MAESFLEEQLKRIREMTEQMSRVRNRAAELEAELARERDARRSPMHEVHDAPVRTRSPKSSSRVGKGNPRRQIAHPSRRRR